MKVYNALIVAAAATVAAQKWNDIIEFERKGQRVLNNLNNKAEVKATTDAPQVELPYEIHVGKPNDEKDPAFYTFANIPYAKPPVKERRFAKPEYPDRIAKKADKPVNDGSSYRVCHQTTGSWFDTAQDFIGAWAVGDISKYTKPPTNSGPAEPPAKLPNASEDCLLLDVVVPKGLVDEGLDKVWPVPVVVWFHGGGYIFGHKNLFNPPQGLFNASQANSTDNDEAIIYVTANYRLGAFGFLTSPDYIKEEGQPNVGLHDQALVLEWVKDHILDFGGDPYSVTVIGESAGASSILHHITAYGGPSRERKFRPPFKRAILQSPAFFPESSDKQEKAIYKEFLNQAGKSDLKGLRDASESDLELANRNMTYNSPYGLFAFGPAVDDDYVKAPLSLKLKFGKYWKDVEVFIAHTGNEGLLFTPPWIQDDAAFKTHVKTAFPDIPNEDVDTLVKLYPAPEPGLFLHRRHVQRVADAMADVAVVCNTGYLLDSFPKQWTYKYVFDISPSIHGQDCLYTYFNGSYDIKNPLAPGLLTQNIATYMQKYIANFAKYGDPNGNPYQSPEFQDTPDWLPRLPTYEHGKVGVFERGFFAPGVVKETADTWYNKTRCDFWQYAPYWQPEQSVQQKQPVTQEL